MIGHGDPRVQRAITAQIEKVDYCHSMFFACKPAEDLARALVDSTGGRMSKAFIVNSGSLPILSLCIQRFSTEQSARL